jgi:hypothetical protein
MSDQPTKTAQQAILKRVKEIDSTAWAFDAEPDAYLERRVTSFLQAKRELNLP